MKNAFNIYKYPVLLTCFVLILAGCNKLEDFGDLNVNPYATTTPVTQNLLTGVLRNLPGTVNSDIGALYAQHVSDVQYTDGGRFLDRNFSYAGLYQGPLMSLQMIIDINSNPETAPTAVTGGSNANQIAVARILKAYFFWHITNRWGDVPYFDALKRGENLTPKFDKQEDIIADLFKELKEAENQFDGGVPVVGDIFLEGDAERWKLFSSSLRLLMALRLSKADPAWGKTEFLDAVASGVIMDESESFYYQHLAETANQNAWYGRYLTRFDYAVSEPFLDVLQDLDDPRIPAIADLPLNGNSNYVGMPYGLISTSGIPNNSVSFVGSGLREQDSPAPIIIASQVLLALAEGEARGWNASGTPDHAAAEDYYLQGIEESMKMFGVYNTGDFNSYVAQPEVAYTAADAIEKISIQRWIALYLNGYEAWAEWRRTGYPELDPGPAPLSIDQQIPRRQAYTTSERDLNLENYNAVVSDQGPDEVNTRTYLDPL